MNRLCIFLHCISLITVAVIFSLIASFVIISPLVLFLMVLRINIPDILVLPGLIAAFCVALGVSGFITWKLGVHTLIPEETKSRGQSLLLWEALAFLLFFFLFAISFQTDWNWPIFAGLSLPSAMLIPALIFPFRRFSSGKHGFWTSVRVGGFAGAFFLFFFGCAILGRAGKEVSYRGNNLAELPRSVQWIGKTYIPAGASEIELSGRNTCCQWSCHVLEKDFLKFKAKSIFEFTLVKKPRDILDKGPFPYYFYINCRGDGGGVTLRYDVNNQKFIGSYASH